ncbi:hypothetical protein HDV01_000264 [Terramyces sp. JEL0728]|nr:hypothetical protein HDV01_000264 [Terramyces sp. JEL0728]
MQYLKARPLGNCSTRFTPIHLNDMWHALYTIRVQTFVLCITCFIEVPFKSIRPVANMFEMSLIQSRLEIPTTETPVLLRFFAKRDTLALLYHNIKTGYTLFPALRPGPEIQLQQISHEFWSMYSEASVYLNLPGVTEFSIVRDSFQFYAKSEGIHKIFLLLAQESVSTNVSTIANEVLRNIKNQISL